MALMLVKLNELSLLRADRREVEHMARRVTAAGEHFAIAGSCEDAGYLLYHFATWAKARAMQHWIDRSGIAGRPMPTGFKGQQLGVGDRAR